MFRRFKLLLPSRYPGRSPRYQSVCSLTTISAVFEIYLDPDDLTLYLYRFRELATESVTTAVQPLRGSVSQSLWIHMVVEAGVGSRPSLQTVSAGPCYSKSPTRTIGFLFTSESVAPPVHTPPSVPPIGLVTLPHHLAEICECVYPNLCTPSINNAVPARVVR